MIKKNMTRDSIGLDEHFASVVSAFAKDRSVSQGGPKGFGSSALKVDGRIFAMMSSRGQFVVKLPREQVDALVKSGQGSHFDSGHGRKMKEWLVVQTKDADWIELAIKAREFVKQGARVLTRSGQRKARPSRP